MAVPFNDTRRKFAPMREAVVARWCEVLDTGRYIGGEVVSRFEDAFAAYCGVQHCIGVANGTDALELALRGLGVRAGDAVVGVANAGGYATAACKAIGADTIYVDVDPATCQMDHNGLNEAVTASTRAVVVTHLYGLMNDVGSVRRQLDGLGRSDISILEDCAQAHGAAIHGARAGSLGDAAAFSFYPTKNLGAIGDGGAVVCKDAKVAASIRSLAQYGWGSKYQIELAGGRNSRMDPIQAIVLEAQLGQLDEWNACRRSLCTTYSDHLPTGWSMVSSEGEKFVGHLAVTIAPDESTRERARAILKARGIGYDIHYPILDCDQPAWRRENGVASTCPSSRSLTKRILSLPCFPELAGPEIEQVIDALRAFA